MLRRSFLFGLSILGLSVAALPAAAETIKVGVSAGLHAQIMDVVKPIAAKRGLDIEIVEFTDYVQPNEALSAGELQANSFQHLPYLENQIATRGYKISPVGVTVNFPIGIYSRKHKRFEDVPDGGTVAIPNDPANGSRVLLLLRDKGFLTLKDGVGRRPSLLDVVGNPKHLKIVEIDAAQTPRSLDDVDAAAINTNYAEQAGLNPATDPILREDPQGPYVNLIAVRTEDKDKPWVKILVESYHSPEVKAFVDSKFKGAVLAGW